ncbi:probable receptor-like protein kinase At5g24010 [Andrographis paniculata]|uniref:probable receptor-like protein kinase At5g24010 n=1 Tax=Andrographis paniculata TaxID=175694 RepID=UPI0021E87528|nr:probable receptor-like protein kinase At5g24010 [Andrographis paniculata]
MAAPQFLTLLILLSSSAAAYTPQDNFLLTCGSPAAAAVAVDNRRFVGDPPHLSSDAKKSISITNPNRSSPLYSTARIFPSSSTYLFFLKNLGTHLLRLHFSPFSSGDYILRNGHVSAAANGAALLTDFRTDTTVVKEFFLNVAVSKLEIVFTPARASSFAYVSAIEIFSIPDDFFIDAAGIALITGAGIQEFRRNLSSQVLETVHRINVGGPKITPFNDTLWRTWIPDDEFLRLKSAADAAVATDPPNYIPGGATRENAPDNVYMTARQMNAANRRSLSNLFNITWDFPVVRRGGDAAAPATHLVRLHFCDIVSIAANTLYFNIYINDVTAYKDIDLSVLTFHQLAAPYYVDFVVENPPESKFIQISVGPSELSNPTRRNAILNGVEIMRMISSTSTPRKSSDKITVSIIAGSVAGGFAILAFLILGTFAIARCKKTKSKSKSKPRTESVAGWTSLRVFGGGSSEATASSPGPFGYYGLKIPFADIQSATNNFDAELIIGSGGFGTVYKGVLNNNVNVAVKRGVPGSRQGLPEFQTEITVLSKIRHRHLVSLVGYCEERSEMVLVYEYMEKGPLRSHLYGSDYPPLSWKQRLEICIGAARGLHYLHTGSAQGIIHRDIKSTNILLDENYVAKVADFGLSKSGPCLDETHVSTGVKGSFGYLDPEYFRRQQLTDKSDVYSFGVVLFEVLCARPAVDPLLAREQVNLAEWAMEWQKKGIIEQIVDTCVVDEIKPTALKKFCETAEKCLAEYGVDRPTMGDVLWNLEYAYQLQTNETANGTDGAAASGGSNESPAVVVVPGPSVSNSGDGTDDGTSDISTTRVFSQLLSSDGR